MISANQAQDLLAIVKDPELKRAFTAFTDTQRLDYVRRTVESLRENDVEAAKKWAAHELAYSELLASLEDFAERQLNQ